MPSNQAANWLHVSTNELYVDGVLGSDTTGTGASNSPYQTINKAAAIIGSASSTADFNDPLKRYYVIKPSPGVYTESPVFGTRPYIQVRMDGVCIVGNPNWNFDQNNLTGALVQAKLIFAGNDLRSAYNQAGIALTAIDGNMTVTSVNHATSLTAQLHLINTGITGNLTQVTGNDGSNLIYTLQVYMENAFLVGKFLATTSVTSSTVVYAANSDTSSGKAIGGCTGRVFFNVLRNVRLNGICSTINQAAARWLGVTFAATAHDFTFSSGAIQMDAMTVANWLSNVPTKGSLTISFFDTAAGVGYTAGAAGNWSGSPIDVKAALDRIAAVVSSSGGTPIP